MGTRYSGYIWFDSHTGEVYQKNFNQPYDTHRNLLPGIIDQYGLHCDMDTRSCKFITQMMAIGNHMTHTVGVRDFMLNEGIIGKNMKYIQEKYGISYSDIIHSDITYSQD